MQVNPLSHCVINMKAYLAKEVSRAFLLVISTIGEGKEFP